MCGLGRELAELQSRYMMLGGFPGPVSCIQRMEQKEGASWRGQLESEESPLLLVTRCNRQVRCILLSCKGLCETGRLRIQYARHLYR